jgi:hypothetical protein
MFSIIRKLLKRAKSFDAIYDRLTKIETKLEQFEKLADENAALWQYLDEQKEMDGVFVGNAEEFAEEFSDIMVRNMKTQGDA